MNKNYKKETIPNLNTDDFLLDENLFNELKTYFSSLHKCKSYSLKGLRYKKKKWHVDNTVIDNGKDIPACYVISYKNEDIYVGISRDVFKRLRQHLSDDENSATFAKKLKKYASEFSGRKEINDFPDNCTFKYVEIKDNYLLAMFEIYASMKLETFWNSFKTH